MLAMCRTDARRGGVTSTDMLPLGRSNDKRRRRKKRQKLWEEELRKKEKKGPVFSQGLVTDTKSVFVCLPGCQIKEFLCVGGSDRVYLTLQLLLWSKCPTVNAGHESHLALDRGSLFSGERGSCLEKIFNGGGVWGVAGLERGCSVCALPCAQTYSGALSPCPNNSWNSFRGGSGWGRVKEEEGARRGRKLHQITCMNTHLLWMQCHYVTVCSSKMDVPLCRTGTNTSLIKSSPYKGSGNMVACTCSFHRHWAARGENLKLPLYQPQRRFDLWVCRVRAACTNDRSPWAQTDLLPPEWSHCKRGGWSTGCFLWTLYPHCSFMCLHLDVHDSGQVTSLWTGAAGHFALQVLWNVLNGWIRLPGSGSDTVVKTERRQFESVSERCRRLMSPGSNGAVNRWTWTCGAQQRIDFHTTHHLRHRFYSDPTNTDKIHFILMGELWL